MPRHNSLFLFNACSDKSGSNHELIGIDQAFSDLSEMEGLRKAFEVYLLYKEEIIKYGKLPIELHLKYRTLSYSTQNYLIFSNS